eukprot:SAG31_NODE_1062_length_10105_cov_11.143814_3_plen_164_part_00
MPTCSTSPASRRRCRRRSPLRQARRGQMTTATWVNRWPPQATGTSLLFDIGPAGSKTEALEATRCPPTRLRSCSLCCSASAGTCCRHGQRTGPACTQRYSSGSMIKRLEPGRWSRTACKHRCGGPSVGWTTSARRCTCFYLSTAMAGSGLVSAIVHAHCAATV